MQRKMSETGAQKIAFKKVESSRYFIEPEMTFAKTVPPLV
jgi:hypothetical protein